MSLSNHSRKPLLSILLVSHQSHHMKGFLENISQTVEDPSSIEILISFDQGDLAMRKVLDDAVQSSHLNIRTLENASIQQLFAIASKESYFFQFLNDEVRFKTKGWDKILASYINFFDDHIFRLRLSAFRYHNYFSHHDCSILPENVSFITRAWLEAAGGIGASSQPAIWHQHVDYHLGQMEGINDIPGIFRSIPINNIEMTQVEKLEIGFEQWKMCSVRAQQEFRGIASRMFAYMWTKNAGIENFAVIEDKSEKKITIRGKSDEKIKKVFYYHLSTFFLIRENFYFLVKMSRRHYQVNYLAKALSCFAALCSTFMPTAESTVRKKK